MPRIKVKLVDNTCKPERTHKWDAGWDLKAFESVVIPPQEARKVRTGVNIEIPPHYCGMVVPRSSLGTKHRVTLANDIGVIDTEYRGEIFVFLSNDSDIEYEVKKGDRFAQLVVVAINNSDLWIVDRLSNTSRGEGGFGSTTEKKWGEDEVPEDEVTFTKYDMADDALDLMKQPLSELKAVEYIKLKKSGKLKEIYPEATGNIKEDLNIGK
jgi:dUTP pyrophosphatase